MINAFKSVASTESYFFKDFFACSFFIFVYLFLGCNLPCEENILCKIKAFKVSQRIYRECSKRTILNSM